MNASELLRRIESKCAPTIIDVRFRSEFGKGHVPGAINTPFFAPKIAMLPKDRSTELVIYCGHGQRAWIAQQLLALRGYRNSVLLEGHAKGWRQAALPLETSLGEARRVERRN